MNWRSQVLHVARKDVRALRWHIAGYTTLVIVSTALCADFPVSGPAGFQIWGRLVMFAILLLMGILVHEDPPAELSAFWATRPLHPSAVLSAKALVAVVILGGIAFLGQVVDLMAYDVPARAFLETCGPSLRLILLVIALPLLLAVVTPTLPTFMLLLIVAVIGSTVLGTALAGVLSTGPGPLIGLKGLVVGLIPGMVVVGALAAAIGVYRMHDASRGRQLFALLAIAWFVPALVTPRQDLIRHPEAMTLLTNPERAMPSTLVIAQPPVRATFTSPGSSTGRTYISVQVRIDSAPAPYRYGFRATEAHMIRQDGSIKPLALGWSHELFGGATNWLDRSVPWMGGLRLVDDASASATVTTEELAAFERGEWRLAIDGVVDVREPQVLADLALEPGVDITDDGLRIRVRGSGLTNGAPHVETRETSVFPGLMTILSQGPTSVSLRNASRHQAIRLVQAGGSGGGLYFPIPSVPASVNDEDYTAELQGPTRGTLPVVDAAWMEGARLRFDRWTLVGNYRASFTVDASADVERMR